MKFPHQIPEEAVKLTKESECGCEPLKKCRMEHEQSHAADALADNPDICKDRKDGTAIWTRSTKQLNESERKAYDKEIECIKRSAAAVNAQCAKSADEMIKDLQRNRKRYE
jgi:hypothetical protein